MPESTEGVAQGATTAMDYENSAESTDNGAETVGKQDRLNKKWPYLSGKGECVLSVLCL